MQDYVTKDNLIALGIKLGDQDVNSLITHLNETIEERIGVEITESLSDEQLDEMVELQQTADDQQLGEWITRNVPEYLQIVQDNIDIVVGELASGTSTINKAVS